MAQNGAASSQVVVVKVKPEVCLQAGSTKTSFGLSRPSSIVAFESSGKKDTLAAAKQAIERAAGHLALNAFASSNSVIIKANGAQLRQIAKLPMVQAIYPNDTL